MAKLVLAVNKTVPIPVVRGTRMIAALIEVGGSLLSKNQTYEMFFEEGYDGVQKRLIAEFKRKGGSDKQFDEMMKNAIKKVERKFSE